MTCRVLVVDDSPLICRMVTRELRRDPEIEVVGIAGDARQARDELVYKRPDVMILDINLPGMDGLTFLRKLMKHYPLPVVIFSAQAGVRAVEALAAGAAAAVQKPVERRTEDVMNELREIVRGASGIQMRAVKAHVAPKRLVRTGHSRHSLQVIGASTGGTRALQEVMCALPEDAPATLITQHMPPGFTASFAARLNTLCAMEVREAVDGDVVKPGLALVAPGDYHMALAKDGARSVVRVTHTDKVNRHRPSVDVLFDSAARIAPARTVGVILTGMGADGAAGLLHLRERGARTIAQNEETCVVFGMPRAAIELGAAQEVLPLNDIAAALLGPEPATSPNSPSSANRPPGVPT